MRGGVRLKRGLQRLSTEAARRTGLPVRVPRLLSVVVVVSGDAPVGECLDSLRTQDLEGIGPVRSYFVDVADLPAAQSPPPGPSLLGRVGRTLAVAGSGLPYMVGLRRRRRSATAV